MYKIIALPHFRKQLKKIAKKYRYLKQAIIKTLENFNKKQGAHIGKNVYKIRLKSKDISRGKSKSFRLIVLIIEVKKYLVPITIYFKGDKANISKKEINYHLELILPELQ